MSGGTGIPVPDDADESTVVVDRGAPGDESTVVVDRRASTEDESTVVVSRGDRAAEDESTVVVSRGAAPVSDDSTIVSDRKAGEAAPTEDDEKTAVVDRKTRALEKDAPRRRRGQLRPAPVPVEVLDRAVAAPGPGAIATYTAREIQAPPVLDAVETGEAATRQDPATIPSVGRRSERAALVVLASVVLAVVVTVVGLIAIAAAVFG